NTRVSRFNHRCVLLREFAEQPGSGHLPVTHDRFWRDSQDLSRFLYTQAAKITQLNHPAFARIHIGEGHEGFIESQHVNIPRPRAEQGFIQRDLHRISSPFCVPVAARVVYENAPDDLRANSEKMTTVFALETSGANQLEIRLIS